MLLNKQCSFIIWKVNFNIRELDITFVHQAQDISANSTVTGILLTSTKSVVYDDSGEATSKFVLNMDFSKIYVCFYSYKFFA